MKLIIALSLFISSLAIAAPTTLNLKMDLEIDGLKESSPNLVVKTDQKKVIENFNAEGDGYFVEITATENTPVAEKDAIEFNFVVGEVFMGERFIISEPKITTNYGQEAEITVGNDDGEEEFSLSIVATEKAN